MKKSRLIMLLCMVCVVALLMPLTVSAAQTTGWQTLDDGSSVYYQADGSMATDEVLKINGKYYGFSWTGAMYTKQQFYSSYNGEWGYFRAKSNGELYVNSWYKGDYSWYDGDYTWYYYGEGGKAASGVTSIDGSTYVFYSDGQMMRNSTYCDYDSKTLYLVGASGTVTAELKPGWNEVGGDWYYVYVEDGWLDLYRSGIYQVGTSYYYFDDNGKMAADGPAEYYDYRRDANVIVVPDADGRLATTQWISNFGAQYYLGEDGGSVTGLQIIDGAAYYFFSDGKLAINRVVGADDGNYYYAGAGGSLTMLETGWTGIGGKWYFTFKDYLCYNAFVTIGSDLYYFDESGAMLDGTEAYCEGILDRTNWQEGYARAHAGGKLYVNEWYYDGTGWQYYGQDGLKVQYGFRMIGNVPYFFEDGYAVTNRTMVVDDGLYIFGDNAKGERLTGTQWYWNGEREAWQFVMDDCVVNYGRVTIGAYDYAFSDYAMVTNSQVYIDGESLAVDGDGHVITTTGWQVVDGEYYYVADDNGTLYTGWLNDTYYMNPYMLHDTVMNIDGELYIFAPSGAAEKIQGEGLHSTRYGDIVYVENGELVKNEWRCVNGEWYYFDVYGNAYQNGTVEVDGSYYLFRKDGTMCSGGWQYSVNGCCYAQDNGKLLTGIQVVDGVQYVFGSNGFLQSGYTVFQQDGAWLVVNGGKLSATISTNGWHQVGSDWYYIKDGNLICNEVSILPGGKTYAFDQYGRMLTDTIYWSRYFGSDGAMQTGWINKGDYWMYADEYGWLSGWGVCSIGGVDYFFDGYRTASGLQTDGDLYYECAEDGRVLKTFLEEDELFCLNGSVYYAPNGDTEYTGWNGDYYFSNGCMVRDSMITVDGSQYYMKPDGKVVYGLYKTWESDDGEYSQWIYAGSNGALVQEDWVLLNGTYYYFDEWGYMVKDGICEINGTMYEFDKDGAYLGVYQEEEVPAPSADGWVSLNGEWYYAYCGEYVTDVNYIGGKWYCFDENGAMYTNTISWDGWSGNAYYYDANGVRVEDTGWVMINGNWYYFNEDHSLAAGLFQLGDKVYCEKFIYDEDTESNHMELCTGAETIDGRLYVFDATGAATGPVTDVDGWYYADGHWYFFSDGVLVRNEIRTIGSQTYAFDYDGQMITDGYEWGSVNGSYGDYYFGADGAMVTTDGWHETEDGWIYISNGELIYSGIVKNGDAYDVFSDGRWVGSTIIALK